jgi:hypothetical protein
LQPKDGIGVEHVAASVQNGPARVGVAIILDPGSLGPQRILPLLVQTVMHG